MKLQGRIYLIGMPGSGKSFFGEQLGTELDYPLIDLDQEIEQTAGKLISDIFSEDGEAYFRKLEADQLRAVSEAHEHVIVSTGGGTPCFHHSMEYMKAHGITVFLDTPKATLIERLAIKSHRPLVQDNVEERVNQLLEKRLPIYREAHLTIGHREVNLLLRQISDL